MDNLNVQIFNAPNNRVLRAKLKKIFTIRRVIFAVFGLIILIEIISAIKTLNPSAPLLVPPENKQSVVISPNMARISLSASNTTFRVKENIPVSIGINSGGRKLSGVDLIIKFNPKILEASAGAIIKGKLFEEYPLASVDTKKGLVSISGVNSAKRNFKGTGRFALINFKAIASGSASLVVNFKKGSTIDSNLVEEDTSKNILETVDNLQFRIQ